MAPKSKSSASSATRKKHARKAAAGGAGPSAHDEPPLPKDKKPKGKEKKKAQQEPRKKAYVPPGKPAPAQPDPLDVLGIAQRISPELLVVLRRLAKKDAITKRRALEELQAAWADRAKSASGDADAEDVVVELVDALPVWVRLMHSELLITITISDTMCI